MHAKMVMRAIENAVFDYDNLHNDFKEIGEIHIKKNVQPAYYQILVQALISTLSQIL